MKGEVNVPIRAVPGVKRDGTEFEGANYVDAQHCRFRRGLPRKIGGWRAITQSLQGPVRSVYIHSGNGVNRVFFGSSSALEYTDLTADGIGGGLGDFTPATLAASSDNIWTFDELYDGGGTMSALLAHAAPNLSSIDSTTQTKVWFGDITGTAVLVDSTAPSVSGGVFCVAPYAFTLDNDGLIAWCVPNTPDDWAGVGSGDARITKSKLVYGRTVRGTGVQTFLVWSLDTLVRGTFAGGAAVFNFNELGTISLMSSRAVVEYNGVFYWMGQDRFQMFNGVIQDLPNKFNLDWLLDNINMNARQAVWGVALPKFGEIWWFVPFGDSTEPTHAVIFNVLEGIWYDTELARAHGVSSSVFRWPVMASVDHSEDTFVRVLHGTPGSSIGVAANAFDGDIATITNAGAGGNIQYDFGQFVRKHIHRVSLIPGAGMTSPCAVEIDYSNDTGVGVGTWSSLLSIPSQAWVAGTTYTFTLPGVHIEDVRAVRARTSGADVLVLAELILEGHGWVGFQHEFGWDAVAGTDALAIPSWFETADVSFAATGPVAESSQWVGRNVQMETATLEPDFEQVNTMTVEVNSRAYPKSTDVATDSRTFDPDTEKVDFKHQGRILRFKFTSNTQGGFYQMGQPILLTGEGDVHR